MVLSLGRIALNFGLVTIVGALGLAACGGSGSPPPDDEGTSTAGSGNEGGSGNTAGSADASGGSSSTEGGSGTTGIGDGYPCAHFEAPGALINDFSTWSASNLTWGDDTTLTGGTFFYDNDGDDTVDALAIDVGTDEAGTVTGTVVGGYAGVGFWFGPCVDASAFDGISFTISGDLAETQIEFQVQSSRNYPIDDNNSKGECVGDWSTCTNNKMTLDLASSDEVTTVQVPWADFADGKPISPLDPTEILGVQWQFNCAADTECSPNVVIDNVQFYPAE